jgi:hypothetical protein
MKSLVIALAAVLASVAFAQVSPAVPPAEALVPDQARLRAAVAGHEFQWHPQDSGRGTPGGTARLQYRDGGLVVAELSSGVFDTGTWTVEGSQLCARWQSLPSGCNDVRIAGETLWLQYRDGKWSSMTLIHNGKAAARAG